MKIIVFLILINVATAFSQDDFFLDKRNFYDFGKKFHAEVHYLPSNNADSITAMVLYRFSYDLVLFQKFGINSQNPEVFYCIPKVEIEFEDKEGIIRSRIIKQDTVFEQEYEKTINKTDFINGAEKINLLNGNYKVTFRISDQSKSNLKRVEINDSSKINYYSEETISNPVFVELNNDSTLNPIILRNNIRFSSKQSKMLIPVTFKDDFTKYNYSIKFLRGKKTGLCWNSNFSKNEKIIPRKNSTIDIDNSSKETIKLMITNSNLQSTNLFQGIVEIPLPIEDIVPGTYSFSLVQEGKKDSLKVEFEVVWEDMPFILQRPRYAIESMYYILTDDEYSKMVDVDFEDYSKEILNYWTKEDPTKFTPFNESMFEFFKRVDYALFNFKTLSETNGIKTDRGKIHILYGKPTSSERKLSDEKTFEYWTYEHLKKQFTFEAKSNGVYKLTDIKEIK